MTLMTTSEGARSWMERFFEAHSAGEREIEQMTAAARGRARRYPFPVAHAFPLLEWALDRVAPLAMMGRARPAHRLDASAFDALEHKLQHHPIALVRGFYMLMRQAALENVYPDISPERPRHPLDALQPVTNGDALRAMQAAVREVRVEPPVSRYLLELVRRTRNHQELALGASPRGSLALFHAGQARAWLAGRDYVTPDDIQVLAEPVLAHRLELRAQAKYAGRSTAQIVDDVVAAVPVLT